VSGGRFGEQSDSLERLISSLHFAQDMSICVKQGSKRETTPLYVLAVEAQNDSLYRILAGEGANSAQKMGFCRQTSFSTSNYYTLQSGKLCPSRARGKTLYVPLQVTKYSHLRRGAKLLGVQGAEHAYPLLLVSETEKGLAMRLVADSSAGVSLIPQTLEGAVLDKVKKYWASLRKDDRVKSLVIVRPKSASVCEEEFEWENPRAIYDYLNQYVVGQQEAKQSVSVVFSNYMVRYRSKDSSLPKDNMLIIGPTGSGKTLMMRLLARKAKLPFIKDVLTSKSGEGFVGDNASNALRSLAVQTKDDAPYGIVFLDEIDKLAYPDRRGFGFGVELQDALIGWLDGASVTIDEKRRISTENLMFVTAGAFGGGDEHSLDSIIRARVGIDERSFGFAQGSERKMIDSLEYVTPDDIIKYGLKSELVGRHSAIATLKQLTVDELESILSGTKEGIFEKYKKLFKERGFNLEFEPGVAAQIARLAPKETGARSLNALAHKLFHQIIFHAGVYAQNGEIKITPDLVAGLLR